MLYIIFPIVIVAAVAAGAPEDIIGIGTYMELQKNENFTGAPIVPANLDGLDKPLQYDENTTALAKGLGKLLDASP